MCHSTHPWKQKCKARISFVTTSCPLHILFPFLSRGSLCTRFSDIHLKVYFESEAVAKVEAEGHCSFISDLFHIVKYGLGSHVPRTQLSCVWETPQVKDRKPAPHTSALVQQAGGKHHFKHELKGDIRKEGENPKYQHKGGARALLAPSEQKLRTIKCKNRSGAAPATTL